mmetsp:Transcript_8972/g.20931  ORF Transcript_8972/g.20931 Transcript_8972/m.20931 type:complete len:92 (+) Transcript_8972:1291-1566(+)
MSDRGAGVAQGVRRGLGCGVVQAGSCWRGAGVATRAGQVARAVPRGRMSELAQGDLVRGQSEVRRWVGEGEAAGAACLGGRRPPPDTPTIA